MLGKITIAAVGVLIIAFSLFGLLGIAEKVDPSHGQVAFVGVPYAITLVSGFGVIVRASWARMVIIAISVFGLGLQIFEISLALDAKDVIEAVLFAFFIVFFSSKFISGNFNMQLND